jgi:hypothetical protein
MFMEVWNDYKNYIRVVQDVLTIKKVVEKSFKANTQVGQEIAKAYKAIF